jgi:hypothetical protein
VGAAEANAALIERFYSAFARRDVVHGGKPLNGSALRLA